MYESCVQPVGIVDKIPMIIITILKKNESTRKRITGKIKFKITPSSKVNFAKL